MKKAPSPAPLTSKRLWLPSIGKTHVGTAALGCPAGRSPVYLGCKDEQRNPRRTVLAWTAEGGCPYAVFLRWLAAGNLILLPPASGYSSRPRRQLDPAGVDLRRRQDRLSPVLQWRHRELPRDHSAGRSCRRFLPAS